MIAERNLPVTKTHRSGGEAMPKYVCGNCGFVYDPEEGDSFKGIPPRTRFGDLPDEWVCPSCGVEKWRFSPQD
jgi:rubredoxin